MRGRASRDEKIRKERVVCGDPSTMVVAFVAMANSRWRCIRLARSPILNVIVHLVVFSSAEVASKGRMEIAGELIQIGHGCLGF